jgi:cell division protein FtsQ
MIDGWFGRLQRRGPPRRSQGVVRQRPVPRRGAPAGASRRSRGGLLRPRPRVVLILLVLVMLLGGAWLWVRDSSLVSVDHVSVTGEGGPDAAQIRSALVAAARNMTTLDVRMDQLRTAVAPFAVVKDLRVSTEFPHGMRIRVIEEIPVGVIVAGGRTIAVAGDGTVLHDVIPSASLPAIPLRVLPGGSRLSAPDALHAVDVLAAAPSQLLSRISQVTTVASYGLVAQLRSGPSIYFGDATRLAAKWTAAAAVLADSGSAGAAYIDVTDPQRPAPGVYSTPAAGAGSSGASSPGASGTTSTSATANPGADAANPASASSPSTAAGDPAAAASGGSSTTSGGG